MAGRFLTPAYVAAALVLAHLLRNSRTLTRVAIVLAVAGVAVRAPVYVRQPEALRDSGPTGIGDERRHYDYNRWINVGRWPPPGFGAAKLGVEELARGSFAVFGVSLAGSGYAAGPRVHYLDPMLCDPLLARLPILDPKSWRVGHLVRRVPRGYRRALALADPDAIEHDGLREFARGLFHVTRGPLWDWRRIRLAVGYALGLHRAGLRDYVTNAYRAPNDVVEVRAPWPQQEPPRHWSDPGARMLERRRLRFVFEPGRKLPSEIGIALDARDIYELRFERDGILHEHSQPTDPHLDIVRTMRVYRVPVPEAARSATSLSVSCKMTVDGAGACGVPQLEQ